jgi:SAM-dependent methyltransferase
MNLETVKSHVAGVPYILDEMASDLHSFILQEQPLECLELGFGHGASSCYIAAALDELGRGKLTAVDLLSGLEWQNPSIEELLEWTGLSHRVEIHREKTGYTWFLKKQIEKQTFNNQCIPIFDFCFIDGAKHWTTDAAAFFLVDKLLKPGGWLVFDDLRWNFQRKVDEGKTNLDGIPLSNMGIKELTQPHIELIFKLLVMQHPDYSHFRIKDEWWAWAKKVPGSKEVKYEYSKSFLKGAAISETDVIKQRPEPLEATLIQDLNRGIDHDNKYAIEKLLNPQKLRKGHTRWNQFSASLKKVNPKSLEGSILDFGCGVGHFVLEGLNRNMDIWGVDCLPGKVSRYKRLVKLSSNKSSWEERCILGSGENLPFESNKFSAISSWFVFEHIPEPLPVLKELVRVLKPNGVIIIRAEDARTSWEAHCKIPWLPYLSDQYVNVWLEEFDCSPDLRNGVYDITLPECETFLEELSCRIILKATEPLTPIENHCDLPTEKQIRFKARQAKTLLDQGAWLAQPKYFHICAQKIV